MNLSLLKKLLPGLLPPCPDRIHSAGSLWTITRFKVSRLKKGEWFPVVNEQGNIIGKAPRNVFHDGKSMLLHPVVHLHLFDSTGRLFLQKRAMHKDIQPGKWDTSAGGHIRPGETIEDALSREVREEIGLRNYQAQFLEKYVWKSSLEKELVFSFFTVSSESPTINKNEIDEGRFWAVEEIRKNISKNIFTPNFEHELGLLVRKISVKFS